VQIVHYLVQQIHYLVQEIHQGSAGAAPRISHSFEPVNEPVNEPIKTYWRIGYRLCTGSFCKTGLFP
jgi:hypothetical protein